MAPASQRRFAILATGAFLPGRLSSFVLLRGFSVASVENERFIKAASSSQKAQTSSNVGLSGMGRESGSVRFILIWPVLNSSKMARLLAVAKFPEILTNARASRTTPTCDRIALKVRDLTPEPG